MLEAETEVKTPNGFGFFRIGGIGGLGWVCACRLGVCGGLDGGPGEH